MTATLSGMGLLQEVADRVISKYLLSRGATRAEAVGTHETAHGRNVDIVTIEGNLSRRIKVKADPYYGVDSRMISDRSFAFYRADEGCLALEAVADSATRQPGWTLSSDAQDLYYYYLALAQTEAEIRALLTEPDEVFFSELAVERDELLVLPMEPLRRWFEEHMQDYAPRPVTHDGVASWYRLVPRTDVEKSLVRVTSAGAIFSKLVP